MAGCATKKKYYMVKCTLINKIKSKGGLGIRDLKLFNISLLYKWWWRLEKEEGMWQTLVKSKYGITHGIWRVHINQNGSAVWKDLLKVKHFYLQGRIMVVDGGSETIFWVTLGVGWFHYVNNTQTSLRCAIIRFALLGRCGIGDGT